MTSDEPAPAGGAARAVPRVVTVLWWLSTLVTAVVGLFFGWLTVALHFFGESADRADYQAGAGVFAVTGLVVATVVVGVLCVGGQRALWVTAALLAALLGLLAVGTWSSGNSEPDEGVALDVGTTLLPLAVPTSWALVVGAVVGIVVRVRRHVSRRRTRTGGTIGG